VLDDAAQVLGLQPPATRHLPSWLLEATLRWQQAWGVARPSAR
jgi:hypothetical protein